MFLKMDVFSVLAGMGVGTYWVVMAFVAAIVIHQVSCAKYDKPMRRLSRAMRAVAQGDFTVSVPNIDVISTIGAGDSAVAGFIYGYSQGYETKKTLAYAVAFGTSACMQSGTQPPRREDVLMLNHEVEISVLKI